MPIEFYSRLKAMREYSALSILAYILIPTLLYFLVSSVVYMKFCAVSAFGLLILIVILSLLKAKNKVKKNAKNLSPYAIKCHGISEEHIINAFTVMQDAFAAFIKYQRISYRFLFIKNDIYNKQDADRKKERANRIINKKYGKAEKQTVYKLKSIRINVQMYYECSEDINHSMQSNAVQLLRRVEPIVNVFVDLKNELVIIPAVCDTLLWKEVQAYCSAISIFVEKLETVE